jgi:hypothetical protein
MLLRSYELLSLRVMNDQPTNVQPFTRTPCATLYSGGQGYNGHTKPEDTGYTPNRSR